jgi:hypothetical protein
MSTLNRIWQPWVLAALVALGFGVAWGFVVGMGGVFLEGVIGSERVSRCIQVLQDGTLVIQTYCLSGGRYVSEPTLETLDGKRIARRDGADLNYSYGTSMLGPDDLYDRRFVNWQFRIKVFSDCSGGLSALWYLVDEGNAAGSAYFEGYDRKSRLRIGYLGRRGYQAEEPAAGDRFSFHGLRGFYSNYGTGAVVGARGVASSAASSSDEDLGDRVIPYVVFLLSGDQLLRVDLRERSVRALRTSADLVSIADCQLQEPFTTKSGRPGTRTRSLLVARTKSELLMLDGLGREKYRLILPESLQRKTFSFHSLVDGTAVTGIDPWRDAECRARNRYTFFWFNKQGRVEKTQSVDMPREPRGIMSSTWFDVVVLPVPAFQTPGILSSHDPDEDLSKTWPALVMANLLGVALAVVCYRRQRRYAQRWTWVWVGFVFLFGLPGLVGYLTHRRWPPLAACPSCHAAAPRDREACSACGQVFPRPASKGTEVFA